MKMSAQAAAAVIAPKIKDRSAALTAEERHALRFALDVTGYLGLSPSYENVGEVLMLLQRDGIDEDTEREYPKAMTDAEGVPTIVISAAEESKWLAAHPVTEGSDPKPTEPAAA